MNYVYVALVLASGLSFLAGMLAILALPGTRPEAPLPPRLECAHGRILEDFCPTCEGNR